MATQRQELDKYSKDELINKIIQNEQNSSLICGFYKDIAIESYRLAYYLWRNVPVQKIPIQWAAKMNELNEKFESYEVDTEELRYVDPVF